MHSERDTASCHSYHTRKQSRAQQKRHCIMSQLSHQETVTCTAKETLHHVTVITPGNSHVHSERDTASCHSYHTRKQSRAQQKRHCIMSQLSHQETVTCTAKETLHHVTVITPGNSHVHSDRDQRLTHDG